MNEEERIKTAILEKKANKIIEFCQKEEIPSYELVQITPILLISAFMGSNADIDKVRDIMDSLKGTTLSMMVAMEGQ